MAPRPGHRAARGRTLVDIKPFPHNPLFNPSIPAPGPDIGPGAVPDPTHVLPHIPGAPTPSDPLGPFGNLPSINSITDIPSAIGSIGQSIQGITNFVTNWLLNPVRLAKLVGGAILLVMGINMAVKQTTGVDIGGHVRRAAEAGAGAAAAAAV